MINYTLELGTIDLLAKPGQLGGGWFIACTAKSASMGCSQRSIEVQLITRMQVILVYQENYPS